MVIQVYAPTGNAEEAEFERFYEDIPEKAMAPHSSTLATSCKELTHWKRLWCWEGLGSGGEWNDRGWDSWMASLTWWTWVCVNSGSRWWTGRPGMLRFMGSQRVGHDWVTELNWTDSNLAVIVYTKISNGDFGSQYANCKYWKINTVDITEYWDKYPNKELKKLKLSVYRTI